jgi:outer membrane lipoprotein-sorting protein
MIRITITLVFVAMGILMQTAATFAAEPGKGAVTQTADMTAFLQGVGKKASNFKTLKTEFVQEKKMAMFKEKLVMKGRIFLEKPNRIAWHVDSPLRYSVLITDKMIRQWDEDTNKVQEISLAKNPVFQNVLGQLTVWFSGEYGSLLETNNVRIVKREPLVIEFIPRDNNLSKKVIKNITITFRPDQNYLQQLRIQEVSGDVTTINFLRTILNAPLDSKSFEVKGRV